MHFVAPGVGAMKRLGVLLCALLFASGCASDGCWDEFWKDLRGDNMKMRGFGGGTSDAEERLAPSGSKD